MSLSVKKCDTSLSFLASSTLAGDSITSDADYGSTDNLNWVIRSGQAQYIEYYAVLGTQTAGPDGHSDLLNLYDIMWGTTLGGAWDNAWRWGLTTFKTSPIFLQTPL